MDVPKDGWMDGGGDGWMVTILGVRCLHDPYIVTHGPSRDIVEPSVTSSTSFWNVCARCSNCCQSPPKLTVNSHAGGREAVTLRRVTQSGPSHYYVEFEGLTQFTCDLYRQNETKLFVSMLISAGECLLSRPFIYDSLLLAFFLISLSFTDILPYF